MAIAVKLTKYLASHGTTYDVVEHAPTISAEETAQQARVSSDLVLKAILLRDKSGYVLAILPASDRLDLDRIRISCTDASGSRPNRKSPRYSPIASRVRSQPSAPPTIWTCLSTTGSPTGPKSTSTAATIEA